MPVLLFHGDNHLEIDEAVRAARQPFNPADILTFDGVELTLPALAEACLTAGLFDPQRLVIVHGLHQRMKGTKKGEGETEEIGRILIDVVPSTTLILVEKDMGGDHALVGLVRAAGGRPKAFATPRRADLPNWVTARARSHSASMDRDAAELLADLVGANPLLLDSELEKLATYAAESGSITPLMVETLVGEVPQDSIFALVDAVAAGNRADALRLLHAQLDHAATNPIEFAVYLIRMLARQVRILLRIRLGQRAGRSTQQITADLKLPRYYADRYFRQARRLTPERLRAAFEQLAALEYALKSGKSDPGTGLDLLVSDLCA